VSSGSLKRTRVRIRRRLPWHTPCFFWMASGTIPDLVVGVLYALVDGALGGLIFGRLYNRFLGQGKLHESG
jgi:hypothetical protein